MFHDEFSRIIYPKSFHRDFSTGLFDCTDDCKTSAKIFCCQGVYLYKHKLVIDGRNESSMTDSELFRGLCLSILGIYGIGSAYMGFRVASMRNDFKGRFEITTQNDWSGSILTCCCYPCALCQQEREINISKRGEYHVPVSKIPMV